MGRGFPPPEIWKESVVVKRGLRPAWESELHAGAKPQGVDVDIDGFDARELDEFIFPTHEHIRRQQHVHANACGIPESKSAGDVIDLGSGQQQAGRHRLWRVYGDRGAGDRVETDNGGGVESIRQIGPSLSWSD